MYRVIKRLMDIVLSGLALVVLAPLLVPIAIALKCTGEHYIFYYQERIGYKNKKFKMIKFATMLLNSPNLPGGLHTTRKDPRLLPLGGFLRKTKINELPQLINILKGDMSIVGPRPLVDKTFDPYPEEVKRVIYNVRPGLTGVGSIVFRDEEAILSKSDLPVEECYAKVIAPQKGALELWYQKNMSLATDIKLIFLTAWVIVRPKSRLMYRWLKGLRYCDLIATTKWSQRSD
jgi:lipopolysaccharide/colanic/teichoic acid biosynthesis glycosyltransferase